jgi:RNA polymerase sigma-70 factor (ECF subfamily)
MSDKVDIKQRQRLRDFLSTEYNKLVSYVYQRLTPGFLTAEPEDIVQDVALNIYSKLDINEPIENLAGYYYRALRNRIIDYQRKPKNHVSIENYSNDGVENYFHKTMEDSSEQDLEDVLFRDELKDKVVEAIDKLQPDQQAIIIETEFNGHSFDELSRRWQIPLGTLLARKHRAIKKLKEILKDKL